MQSDGHSGLRDLEAELASKERECKELQAARLHHLESCLTQAQEESSKLRECYQQMKEDFQFNLSVLEERDRELERYDVITTRAVTVEHNRQEELNGLRLQVSTLLEQRARDTEQRHHTAAQHTLQLDHIRLSMAAETEKQTEEYERTKWDLQCRIQELEGQLTLQRQELTAVFDCELKQREHELNLRMDEMRAVLLARDIKVKLLSKESEVEGQAHLQTREALTTSVEVSQRVQTQLLHKEQEIQDLTAAKDHRIKELEDQLKWMETKLEKEEDEHIKKCDAVMRAVQECNSQLEAQSQAHTQQLSQAEKHIVKLQHKKKAMAAQAQRIQEDQLKTMGHKDETVHRLLAELETVRTGWDQYMSQVSGESVVKATELMALQERESRLRSELDRSREEVEGYKQQLSAGLKRERSLEQMGVQTELECQRRCEELKAEHYLANEQLIKELSQARDQANAELRKKEQELQDLTVLLSSVRTERDQALQGVTPVAGSLASEEIHGLQQQNSILRAMVSQMRKDMEALSHLLPPVQTHTSSPPAHSIMSTTNTQVASGIPHQPTDGSAKVNPTGGLSQEKGSLTPALVKQDVRETQSAPSNIIDQSALVRLLQQENLCLRGQQQQTSGQLCAALFAKGDAPVLRSRLKQAALCITRLSMDKLQLIEMGNRLRTLLTTAAVQEPEEPKRDRSIEKQAEQPDRLSALEQLQYQLTTQELQYALRQRDGGFAQQLLPTATHPTPATQGAAHPRSQGHTTTTDRPESSKNKEMTPPVSQSQGSLDVRSQLDLGLPGSRLSSVESLRSLKELWDILDHGLSSSVVSEGEGQLSRMESGGVQMMVHGVSAPVHSQTPTHSQHPTHSQPQPRLSRGEAPSLHPQTPPSPAELLGGPARSGTTMLKTDTDSMGQAVSTLVMGKCYSACLDNLP